MVSIDTLASSEAMLKSLKPLRSALEKLQDTPETLAGPQVLFIRLADRWPLVFPAPQTPVHSEFLRVCLKVKARSFTASPSQHNLMLSTPLHNAVVHEGLPPGSTAPRPADLRHLGELAPEPGWRPVALFWDQANLVCLLKATVPATAVPRN